MDHAYKLKKEYSASGLPVFITDEEMNILWKNDIGSSVPDLGESAEFIFDSGVPCTGLVVKEINGEVCTFNVIRSEDAENNRFYYIIELVSSRELGGIVSAETVRGYISYICSKIRAAAGDIISVTDRLFEDISAGTLGVGRAAEGFDKIYESAAVLEREIAYPDRLYSLIDPKRPDDIIILDREMIAVAAGIKSSLRDRTQVSGQGDVRISEDYDRDIFFRMNADSFETAVASMAAECCGTEHFPERIIFSARRSGRNRAEVTVMSLDIGNKKGSKDSSGSGSERSFTRKLLSEYVYDVLGLKNGARFSKENIPSGVVFRMNIEALPREASVFAEKPVDGSDRRHAILDKLEFFFGNMPEMERRRYTSRSFFDGYGKNDGEPDGLNNIYREDIENEKSEV